MFTLFTRCIPCPSIKNCGCGNRVWNNVHFSHSQQKRLWHAVSPRKIRRCRLEDSKQLRHHSEKVTRKLQLIPAIDLMNGKIVRLSRGDPKTAKVYDQFGGPVETAKKWKEEGATKLHIIDLDAAFGTGDNLSDHRGNCRKRRVAHSGWRWNPYNSRLLKNCSLWESAKLFSVPWRSATRKR